MKNKPTIFVFKILLGLSLLCFLFGFTPNNNTKDTSDTKDIAGALNPSILREVYRTVPQDLSSLSKCPMPPTLLIINNETRNDDYLIHQKWGSKWHIKRGELNGHIVDYMKEAFEQCKIKTDLRSSKNIYVSFKDVDYMQSNWNKGVNLNIKVDIPDIEYTTTYELEEWSGTQWEVIMAYAIHQITWQMIADPVVQNYLLCK